MILVTLRVISRAKIISKKIPDGAGFWIRSSELAAKTRIGVNALLAFSTILIAFAVRFFAFHYTYAINNDGVFYIHQARAFYYGDWSSLLSCALGYLSNYPLFIAGSFPLFGDWVVAAKFVSFIFGSCTVIPLYFLFRHFFDQRVSILGTLIFALIPDQVARSGDTFRDPIAWFFLALGMLFVIRKWNGRNLVSLSLSSFFFLLAGWARIETFFFLLIPPIFILSAAGDMKVKRCSAFVGPIAFATLIGILAVLLFNIPVDRILRVDQLLHNLSAPAVKYMELRKELAVQAHEVEDELVGFFLPEARRFVWLIALSAVVSRIIGAFYLPYFVLFIFGLPGALRTMAQDKRILYFVMLAASGLIFMYAYTLYAWLIYNRFMAIFIFPSFVFIGFGIQKTLQFTQARLKRSEAFAIACLCAFIFAVGLPKALQSGEQDKLVYREIGEFIAAREDRTKPIRIAGFHTPPLRLISFYANLGYPGAPCPISDALSIKGGHVLIPDLKKEGVRYLLWEEKAWSNKKPRLTDSLFQQQLREVGGWRHRDTGRIILYEIK